jgi:hypothetical protein
MLLFVVNAKSNQISHLSICRSSLQKLHHMPIDILTILLDLGNGGSGNESAFMAQCSGAGIVIITVKEKAKIGMINPVIAKIA